MASVNVNDLPRPILSDIFSRVSVIRLLQYRCVCKLWLEIIDDQRSSYVVNLARGGEKALFYLRGQKLYLVRLKKEVAKLTEVAELDQLDCGYWRGSCNGLVLFEKILYSGQNQIFILNPVTKETLALPERPQQDEEEYALVTYGLGLDSTTNTYKMVRIAVYDVESSYNYTIGAHVYDLKSQVWRSCKVPPPYPGNNSRGFVFASGAVNWFVSTFGMLAPNSIPCKDAVLSFDTSKEEFSLIPAPQGVNLGHSHQPMMLELGGSLALVDYSSSCEPPSVIVIYVLKDIASREWTSKYRIRCCIRFYNVIGLYSDGKQLLLYNKRKRYFYFSCGNGKRWPRHGPKDFRPYFDELFYITPGFSSLKRPQDNEESPNQSVKK